MAQPLEDVYCTLLMSDSYLPGAAVLSHSLRDAGTTKKLAVLVTLETLSADTVTQLNVLYDYVIPVERIQSPNLANLYLMGRPDLSYAFTKIALWRQTRFRKIVYLDADVVALRALDELFDIEAPFAAAPDIGWPDAFNSGVMVLTPGMGEYWALHTLAVSGDSFDGADQGLLNQYYENRPWQRLKFTYNTTPNAEYQWEPAYQHYKKDINAVHFIGKTKPWSNQHLGRSSGSGVYRELLAHWWAVHDRHAQDDAEAKSAQNTTAHSQNSDPLAILPAEPLLTNSPEHAEDIDQGIAEPTPTAQLPKFSAPNTEWDATRSEPPVQSKPEAANFPNQTYTFSDSRDLFQAPGSYPEPPKDMWYQVPGSRPQPAETLKPIFPWEQQPNRVKATRVFAEDLQSEPTPVIAAPSPTHAFSTVHYQDDGSSAARETSPTPGGGEESWDSFQQHNANAWDNVPGIDNYVRAIMDAQTKKGKPQTLQQATGTEDISSPVLERRNRRESLILTDFPSAIERPSLPVTPAPQRRPSFWGEERNGSGELPAATGVPDQTEWNPEEKLDQLRRLSFVEFEHLKNDEHPSQPSRTLPEDLPHDGAADSKDISTPTPKDDQSELFKPGFSMSDFGTEFARRQTDPSSPTETRDFASREHAKHGFPKPAVPEINVVNPDVEKKDTLAQTTNTEKNDSPTASTNSGSTTAAGVAPGDEPTVRFTEKAENADPNEKNVSADKQKAVKQDVAKPSETDENDVADRGVPKTETGYRDVVEKDVPERDVGLKRDVAGGDTTVNKDSAEPKAVAVEDDVKADVVDDVVAEKVASKQDPLANNDSILTTQSATPKQETTQENVTQKEPTSQKVTDLSSDAKRELPQQGIDSERGIAERDTAADKDAIQPDTVATDDDIKKGVAEKVTEEEVAAKQNPVSGQSVASTDEVSKDGSRPSVSTQEPSQKGSAIGEIDDPSLSAPSSRPKTTDEQDESAGIFSTIINALPNLTSPESSKSQLPSTEPSTSVPEQDSTLSTLVKAGQNFLGLGISEPQQGASSDLPPTRGDSTLEDSSPGQESTLSGLIQTGKDLVGLGTSESESKPSGGIFPTSDKSISHVPTSKQGSTVPSAGKGSDISAGDSVRGQYPSLYDSPKGSGSVGQITSHRLPSGGSSLSSSEQLPQQPTSLGRDFKYSDSARTGGGTPGSYLGQLPSTRPYDGSSYTSQLERLYDSPSASSPPTSERFHTTSAERYPSLSGRPSSSSLYGTAASSASPPLPSYSQRTSTSRPTSIYSELPSLSSHYTSTSRPSSYYGASATETPSPLYGSGISTTERPSSRRSSVVSTTDRPSSLYGGGASITERPSSLYGRGGVSSVERPSSFYGSVGAPTERPSSLYGSGTSITERPSSLYGSVGASSTARPSSLYGDTPLSPRASSSSNPQYTTSLSHSNPYEPSSFSSASTYKPYSSSGTSYSPSLGRSAVHESTAMHHSLSPSPSYDRSSASIPGHSGYSTTNYGTRDSSSGYTAPLEYSPVSSFSPRFSSSTSARPESSATGLPSSLMEGSYTQQILAGQTKLHVPGFEENAFKVPDKDHVEKGIDSGNVKFSRDEDEDRGRRKT